MMAGCASSSATAPSASGSGEPTQGCLAASVGGAGHASRTARLLALTADPVPIPDDIDVDGPRPTDPNQNESEQNVWVSNSKNDAQQNVDNAPSAPQGDATLSDQNLSAESDAVAPAEELTLLADDYTSGDEIDFGEEICNAIEQLINSGDDLDSVSQVVADVKQLTPIAGPSGSPAPSGAATPTGAETALKTLVAILNSAGADFTSVFGPCESDIDVAEWLLKTIQEVFCTSEPSG